MTQMLELTHEKFKPAVIITMSKNSKERVVVMSEQTRNRTRKMTTIRENQMDAPEPKTAII